MSNTILELPCGVDLHGQVKRQVEIRKMKGSVQRDVARIVGQKNPEMSAAIDAVLNPSIVSLEGESLRPDALRVMYIADRDWLLFEVLKLLRGDKVTLTDDCEKCEPVSRIEYPDFDLVGMPLTKLDNDRPWWNGQDVVAADVVSILSPGDRKNLLGRCFVVENKDLGARAVFRYPNGADQKMVGRLGDKPVEVMWKLLCLCLLQWKDPERELKTVPKNFNEDFWGDVDLDVLEWSQKAFAEAMPGLDTVTELECPRGHKKKTQVSAFPFLLQGSAQA